MAERKPTRKELLNEPDEFLSFTSQAIMYMREHPRYVSIAAGFVLVCVLAAAGIYGLRQQRLHAGHELVQATVLEYDALDQSKSETATEKWDTLFTRFDTLAKDYSSYPAGEVALLYSGHVLYKKQDYRGALERYEKMKSSGFAKGGLEQLILYHVAETQVALKEYDQAIRIFQTLAQDTDSPYRREAYASIARIYEMSKKNKEAVQAYSQYLKIFPEAPDAAFVKARIADLSTQS